MEGDGNHIKDIKERIRNFLKDIPEYIPGKSVEEVRRKYGLKRVIKLASNENPYGCSPNVIESISDFKNFHIYPPSDAVELREEISRYIGFEEDMIALGAGMDGIMETIFRMCVRDGDKVAIPIPTYTYYETLARMHRAVTVFLKRDEEFKTAEFERDAVLTILNSPNNPTGNVESFDFVREIVESVRGLVFIDEAYAEFTQKRLTMLAEMENVIIGRTFSKAFGLANLRIGYAIMHPDLRREFMKVSTPFPLSNIAIIAAISALKDREYMENTVRMILAERRRLEKKLKSFFRVYPSEANFIYVESEHYSSTELSNLLERRGIIVRDCSNFRGCSKHSLRISVGKREENDMLIEALEEIHGIYGGV